MGSRRARPRNDDDRILPLVNVVFLLLIFFMVAGRLSAGDPFAIEPPRSASEGAVAPEAITILVGADGRLALDGAVVDEASLGPAVAGRLAGAEGLPVRIKADGGTEATRVVALLEILREAGVETARLLTVPERR